MKLVAAIVAIVAFLLAAGLLGFHAGGPEVPGIVALIGAACIGACHLPIP